MGISSKVNFNLVKFFRENLHQKQGKFSKDHLLMVFLLLEDILTSKEAK